MGDEGLGFRVQSLGSGSRQKSLGNNVSIAGFRREGSGFVAWSSAR